MILFRKLTHILVVLFSLSTFSLQAQTAELVFNPETLEPGFPFEFTVKYGTREQPVRNLVSATFVFSYAGFSLEDVQDAPIQFGAQSWFGGDGGANAFATVTDAAHTIKITVIRNNGRGVSGYGDMLGGKKSVTNIVEIFPYKQFDQPVLISAKTNELDTDWAFIAGVKGTRQVSVAVEEGIVHFSGQIRTLDGRLVASFQEPGLVDIPGSASGLYIVQVSSERGMKAGKVLVP